MTFQLMIGQHYFASYGCATVPHKAYAHFLDGPTSAINGTNSGLWTIRKSISLIIVTDEADLERAGCRR